MEFVARFKHLANCGDLLSCLPTMKKYWELTGKRVVICQQLNNPAAYPIGSQHPMKDDTGKFVSMNKRMLELVTPLLEHQQYIAGVEEYVGQEINVDLDIIRQKCFVNLPFGAIQTWPMLAYPDLGYDLTLPWIDVDGYREEYKDKILINFTDRYRNHIVNYFFLKEYEASLLFAGTQRERDEFCEQWKLDIPLLEVKNFLELAVIMKSCKFLLSNQSMCWNLAEGMKAPRILELSLNAPNCIPFIGQDSYGFMHQVGVELYVKQLFNKQ